MRADDLILDMLAEGVLKLGLSTVKPEAQDDSPTGRYMKDYYDQTQPHPLDRSQRIHGGGADFAMSEVRPVGDRIHISWLQAAESGKGLGSQALKHLTSLADKHGVDMDLSPVRPAGMRGPGLSNKGLRSWYGRHGFKSERGATDSMVRKANRRDVG